MVMAGCQDARSRKEIVEIDCPECGAEGTIELFVKDGLTAEAASCEACGFQIPEETAVEEIVNDNQEGVLLWDTLLQ